MARIYSDKPVLHAWTYNFLSVGYDYLNRSPYRPFVISVIEERSDGWSVTSQGGGKYPWFPDRPMFETEDEVHGWMKQVNYDAVVRAADSLREQNTQLRKTERVNFRIFEERIEKLYSELKTDFRRQLLSIPPRGRIRTKSF